VASVTCVVSYMYRVIDDLHREQQVMREQIRLLHGSHSLRLPEGHPAAAQRNAQLLAKARGAPDDDDPFFHQHYEQSHAQPRSDPGWQHSVSPAIIPFSAADHRRLGQMFTIGTSNNIGCFSLANLPAVYHDVSAANGCGLGPPTVICPDCFITPSNVDKDITLTVQNCKTARWVRSNTRAGIWQYTFINTGAYVLTVTDNSGSGNLSYNVAAGSYTTAYCSSSQGTNNRLYFPSSRVPTLTVDNSMTLNAGNFDGSSSSGTFATTTGTNTLHGDVVIDGTKTFTTGTGAVTIKGATTVDPSTAFTVGSSGSGGTSTFYGDVNIGSSTGGHSVTTTIYGTFTQNDDGDGTTKQFTTAGGGHYLNGNINVAAGKHLRMLSGSGQFETGTGSVTLNGDTTITSTKTFTTGAGAVTLAGDTTVSNSKTFSVGANAGSGGQTTIHGEVQIGSSTATGNVVLYGAFAQNDVGGAGQSFSTATGSVLLNGHVTVGADKNLHMTSPGTGTFQTSNGTVTLNGDTAVSGNHYFYTGTGAVRLNGATAVADYTPFTVGNPGAGGISQFHGHVRVGSSAQHTSNTLWVHGPFHQFDDPNGTKSTFETGDGQVTINGNIFMVADRNLVMADSGTGGLTTGTGTIYLNGNTEVSATKSFTLKEYGSGGGAKVECAYANTASGYLYCRASR